MEKGGGKVEKKEGGKEQKSGMNKIRRRKADNGEKQSRGQRMRTG